MIFKNYSFILIFIFCLSSCKDKKSEKDTSKIAKGVTTDLQVDHFNIWVKDPKKAKEKLNSIGFTSQPDSLSEIHKGQGTSGRYFYFFNNYLELIFVYNQEEFKKNNEIHTGLDFTKRANFKENGASPFSIALKVKDYNVDKIPFKTIKYHQDWMIENESIYAAKNSKTNLKEPSIFVVYPEMESGTFESLADLQNFPAEDDFWKAFFKHPNGAQKITKITITSTNLNLNTETIKAVQKIKELTIKNGTEHLMELHFDHHIQGKTFDLRPELPLIIYL
ncbi:MAG: VOC family protein [Polaribacter sp.]